MKDEFTTVFLDVVKETQVRTGYELPHELEAYVVMLLSYFVDKPNYLPEASFAEAYLRLQKRNGLNAKQLGDTCLFVCGVFPTYGSRYGLNKNYYNKIGISSYELVAEAWHNNLFDLLAIHFDFLSNFIDVAIHSSNSERYNLFR